MVLEAEIGYKLMWLVAVMLLIPCIINLQGQRNIKYDVGLWFSYPCKTSTASLSNACTYRATG